MFKPQAQVAMKPRLYGTLRSSFSENPDPELVEGEGSIIAIQSPKA
jgi:hypothetical protein